MNPSRRPDTQSETPARPELAARTRARALLGDLLAAVFNEFHNTVFDALYAACDEHSRAQVLQVLRSLKKHQTTITSGFCADVDASFSTFTRTTDSGTVVDNPLLARRLLDALSARCAVLMLDQEQQRWLLRTLEQRVLDTLPEVYRSIEEYATPNESEPSGVHAQVQATPPRLAPLQLTRTTPPVKTGRLYQALRGERATTDDEPSVAASREDQTLPVAATPEASEPRLAAEPDPPAAAALWEPEAYSVAAPEPLALEPDPPSAAAPREPEAYSVAAPEEPRPRSGAESRRLDWYVLALGGGAVTMTVLVVAGMVFLGGTAPQPVPVPTREAPTIATEVPTIATAGPAETPAPEPVVGNAAPPASDTDTDSDSVTDSDSEPLAQQPADMRLAQQTRYLLQRGDRAFADLRLTEPFEDSAAANYLAVLAIDRGNAQATRGLERIVDDYASMARFQLRKGKPGLAREYLQRARSLQPESKTLDELTQEIDRASMAKARR